MIGSEPSPAPIHRYGITGNTEKTAVWKATAQLASWLVSRGMECHLDQALMTGLTQRNLVDDIQLNACPLPELARRTDVVLSIGGDGTLLQTAHSIGTEGTPILGVNIGRLGFLADVELTHVQDAVANLQSGKYHVDHRLVLEVIVSGEERAWALNDVVITRSGPAGLIALDVTADGQALNRYWADGLIVATPTGSTGYSLAVGGPIIAPATEVVMLSPIAPHSLTVRPIVLSSSVVFEIRVTGGHLPYIVAADGVSMGPRFDSTPVRIQCAPHTVPLVKFPDLPYFQTLRNKLSWGLGPQGGAPLHDPES